MPPSPLNLDFDHRPPLIETATVAPLGAVLMFVGIRRLLRH
jgi:hypothetical protein